MPQIYSPSYRILSQPDTLKLAVSKAFAFPAPNQASAPEEDSDSFSFPRPRNPSEDSLLNEIIHGVANATAKKAQEDPEASTKEETSSVPNPSAAPTPAFATPVEKEGSHASSVLSMARPISSPLLPVDLTFLLFCFLRHQWSV